jgi:hypothetical protein
MLIDWLAAIGDVDARDHGARVSMATLDRLIGSIPNTGGCTCGCCVEMDCNTGDRCRDSGDDGMCIGACAVGRGDRGGADVMRL